MLDGVVEFYIVWCISLYGMRGCSYGINVKTK